MYINSNFYSPYKKQNTPTGVSFGSTMRCSGGLNHYTCFFRNNFPQLFADAVKTKFPNGVKIYDYACSDGSEAYGIAMTLRKDLGNDAAQKYFPIIAADLGQDIVNLAQKGSIQIDENDKQAIINKIGKKEFKRLFNDSLKTTREEGNLFQTYKVSDELKNTIKFEQADFIKDVKNRKFSEDGKPCIIIFRNAFYLLEKQGRPGILKHLADNPGFPAGSIIHFSAPQDPIIPVGLIVPEESFVQLDKNFNKTETRQKKVKCGGEFYTYQKI